MTLAEVAVLVHDAPGHHVHIRPLVVHVICGTALLALLWSLFEWTRDDIMRGVSGGFELLQPTLQLSYPSQQRVPIEGRGVALRRCGE